MTTKDPSIFENENPGIPVEEVLRQLRKRHTELSEAMQRLLRFQRQTLEIKKAISLDDTFDQMEILLTEVLDFTFARLFFRDEFGNFHILREICPEEITSDASLMDWAMGTQEVAVIPIDQKTDDADLHSLLLLPFGSSYILLLWLEQDTAQFTQEQAAQLAALSRETSSVLEAQHYRVKLEKTKAVMSDIIESVPHGMAAFDYSDNLTIINSTAEIALNVKRQEALGKPYADSFPAPVTDLIKKMQESGSLEEQEITLDLHGGNQYLGFTITPIHTEDGVGQKGHVVIFRDLQLSREVRKLRELDSMKNDFLSLVSHELRTPLTSILAYSETLLMEDMSGIPGEWPEYLQVIHNEGQKLCRMIDNILDLTKMEAGKMDYEFSLHNPNDLIGISIMGLNAMAEAKQQQIVLELDEDIGLARIAADRFVQVLNNLISNAIKYTNEQGRIIIRSKKTAPLPGSSVPTFTIEIEDNGVGIAPENVKKIFSKFELVGSIAHHSSGTGLGMAICKQIIEDGHNGVINLESELGAGTRVFVTIPMH